MGIRGGFSAVCAEKPPQIGRIAGKGAAGNTAKIHFRR